MGAALFQILQRFSEPAIDQRLGGKRNLPVLYRGLQQIADLDVDLFANVLRNDDLELVLDGDNLHGV